MPRALGARVLRRGAGPGVLPPLILSRVSVVCGARRGLRLAGGVWGAWHAVGFWGGAPWCPGPLGLLLSFLGGSGVVGGLVVNCIVDASICGRPRYRELCCWSPVCLFFCLVRRAARAGVVRVARAPCVVLCVVRFYERSVDALASGADEGRGGLRYSSGSRLAGCDPRVSEWGDPAPVVGRHPRLNVIGRGG